MTKKYTVQVVRSYFQDIEIVAESEDEAVRMAEEKYDEEGDDIMTRDTKSEITFTEDV